MLKKFKSNDLGNFSSGVRLYLEPATPYKGYTPSFNCLKLENEADKQAFEAFTEKYLEQDKPAPFEYRKDVYWDDIRIKYLPDDFVKEFEVYCKQNGIPFEQR